MEFVSANTNSNRWERIWLLAKIEFKLRYNENKLGLIWALLKPLIQLGIYFVAFKIVLRNNIPDFAIYLFCGIIIYQFFLESTGGLISILKSKKYLYEYSNMAKWEIYVASLISVSLGFFFNLMVLLLILVINGIGISVYIFYFPVLFIFLFVLCFGISLIISNLFLLAKDINQIWPLCTLLLMWLSPIFLSSVALKSAIPFIGIVNPMFGTIVNFRNILMYNMPPDFQLLLFNLGHSVLAICIGLLLLNKVGKRASELL